MESLVRLYLLRHVVFDRGAGLHDTPVLTSLKKVNAG